MMGVFRKGITGEQYWEQQFADDLVVMAETEEEDLQRIMTVCQESLELGGLKINAGKLAVTVSSNEKGKKWPV